MQTVTVRINSITAADLLRVFGQFLTLCALYLWQTFRNACRMAHKLARIALHWLRTSHDFSNEEGEIILTGWQYIGVAFAVTAFALLVSIDWDHLA